MPILIIGVITLLFIINGLIDIETKKISIIISLLIPITSTIIRCFDGNFNLVQSVTGFIAGFVVSFFILVIWQGFGGGDSFLLGCLGWVVGPMSIIAIMVLSVIFNYILGAIMLLNIRKTNRELSYDEIIDKVDVPFAPEVGIAYLVITIIQICITGGF